MAPSLQPHRRPPPSRSVLGQVQPSPSKQSRSVSGSKRPHSPEHGDLLPNPTAKRVRSSAQGPSVPVARDVDKEKKNFDKEQQAIEFKEKYRRAFPGWIFYLDTESLGDDVESFASRIQLLKATIDPFFSKEVTHVITNVPIPQLDKENLQSTTKPKSTLKSPIKLVGREQRERDNIVDKAIRFGSKIWNGEKLESVLSRCLESQPTKSSTAALSKLQHSQQRQLSRLLHTEKIHGTTERDPTQKRHDYHYFSRGSCFVLLEDIRQELATIAAHEYPVFKERDKLAKKPWPVLHCHPRARNPFLPYDDREKKRWERLQQAEKEQEEERMATKRELQALKARKVVKATNDLRKSVSVSNLHRRHSVPTRRTHDDEPFVDLDNEDGEPANASGYIAASGNSVGITSTTGTTSTAGRPGRANSLTPAIAGRLKNHVVTSLKFPAKDKPGEKVGATGTMGPPSQLPNKENVLKRSKSTNTLRLPKRQEGVKPGYCESCRIKFSDFNDHTVSNRHRKFASNDANFQALDAVIQRVRRKTLKEVEREEYIKIRVLFGKISLRPLASNSRLS